MAQPATEFRERWCQKFENAQQTLLLVGPRGTGKTWLECALGNAACRQGHTVRYLRLPRLLSEELVLARADGSYGKLMQTLARTDLLILDDWASPRSATANGAISSNSSRTTPAGAPRSSPPSSPSTTGAT